MGILEEFLNPRNRTHHSQIGFFTSWECAVNCGRHTECACYNVSKLFLRGR